MKLLRLAGIVSRRKSAVFCISTLALATSASADIINKDFVQNGGFEQTTLNQSYVIGNWGSNPVQELPGWTNSPTGVNNYVFLPGTADTTGAVATSAGPGVNFYLYGPGNGINNGLTAASPAGGNYLALDGDPGTTPITQAISGLIPGASYTLSFYYAGAQAFNNAGTTPSGDNTERLQVSLGSDTQSTPVLQNASHGFTGWQQQTLTFTANSSNEVLSFLSIGTPSGIPPISLLDGVSLVGPTEVPPSAVPEPSSWALMLMSGVGLAGIIGRRRKSASSTR